MQRYYHGLDVVRFLSACAVCLFHLGFYGWAANYSTLVMIFPDSARYDFFTPVAWMGWVGVEIFFVISGFVIANSANGASPFAFARSRLLRLWPAAWICATLTLLVRMFAGESFGELDGPWLRSVLLIPQSTWIDGVYWSLAVEIVFYGLVFLMLLTRSFRRLPAMAWLMTVASAGFITLAWLDASGLASQGEWFHSFAAQAELFTFRHGVFFAIGIWIWMMANKSLTPIYWIGFCVAGVFGLAEIELRAWEMQGIEAPASAGQLMFAPAVVWIAAVAFITTCAQNPERFAARTDIGRRRMKFIGRLTYPLYLVHSVVGAAVIAWLVAAGVNSLVALGTAIALIVGIASLVALYGESLAARPLRVVLDAIGRSAAHLKPLAPLFKRADAIPMRHP